MTHAIPPSKVSIRSVLRLLTIVCRTSFLALILLFLTLGLLLALAATLPHSALAQGGANGLITYTTVAEFEAACTVLPGVLADPILTNTTISPAQGGEIRLPATLEDYFDDASVNGALWQEGQVYTFGGTLPSQSGGLLILNGSYLRSQMSFTQPARFFETLAQTRAVSDRVGWVHLGYILESPPVSYTGSISEEGSIRMFIDGNDAQQPGTNQDGLFVQAWDFTTAITPTDIDFQPDPDLTQFQEYRIKWDGTNGTRFLVNGSGGPTIGATPPLTSWVWLYAQEPLTNTWANIDWVRAGQYPPNGTYLSCVQDGGGIVNWTTLSAITDLPAGTSVSFESRTSVDGVSWSAWTAVSGGNITSPSGQYFQYRANLSTSDVTDSPEIQQVSMSYFGPSSVVVTPGSAQLNPGDVQQFNAQAYDQNNRLVSSLNYSWQVFSGVGQINSSGLFTTANISAGSYTNSVQASTTGATTLGGFANVIVNGAPTAEAGGPYSGEAGLFITINGSGSSDPNNDILSYGWDLDNDGQYDDAFTATANYRWGAVGTYTIRLLVTDTIGITDTDTAQAIVGVAHIYLPLVIK